MFHSFRHPDVCMCIVVSVCCVYVLCGYLMCVYGVNYYYINHRAVTNGFFLFLYHLTCWVRFLISTFYSHSELQNIKLHSNNIIYNVYKLNKVSSMYCGA